jgi:hypothetical protein
MHFPFRRQFNPIEQAFRQQMTKEWRLMARTVYFFETGEHSAIRCLPSGIRRIARRRIP